MISKQKETKVATIKGDKINIQFKSDDEKMTSLLMAALSC
jgi:hypothetical protein